MKSLSNPFDCDMDPSFDENVLNSPEKCKISTVTNVSEAGTNALQKFETETVNTKAARKQKDARSSLVDMEYEEHLVRMKILAAKQEHQMQKKRLSKDLANFRLQEHQLKMKMLKRQMNSSKATKSFAEDDADDVLTGLSSTDSSQSSDS